jgi:hypothetical protein
MTVKWRPAGAGKVLRLILIEPLAYRLREGGKLLYREPAYLICTDPALPLAEVLQAYLWRWGIEEDQPHCTSSACFYRPAA